jgi:hypothetical protein
LARDQDKLHWVGVPTATSPLATRNANGDYMAYTQPPDHTNLHGFTSALGQHNKHVRGDNNLYQIHPEMLRGSGHGSIAPSGLNSTMEGDEPFFARYVVYMLRCEDMIPYAQDGTVSGSKMQYWDGWGDDDIYRKGRNRQI